MVPPPANYSPPPPPPPQPTPSQCASNASADGTTLVANSSTVHWGYTYMGLKPALTIVSGWVEGGEGGGARGAGWAGRCTRSG